MIVTKDSNPSVYNQMLAARRASLIQAALVVHKAEAWVTAQKNQMALESQEITAAKEQSLDVTVLNVVISKHEEQVVPRHKDLAARLQVFESALAKFKARITAANRGENLAGFDMTRDNNYQYLACQFAAADCQVPGKDLYAALDRERALSRFDEDFMFGLIIPPLFVVGMVGYLCGLIVCPWLFLLIPAAIIVGIVVMTMVANVNDQIKLDQPVFSDKELTALLDDGKVPAVKVSVSPSSMYSVSPSSMCKERCSPFGHNQTEEEEHLLNASL